MTTTEIVLGFCLLVGGFLLGRHSQPEVEEKPERTYKDCICGCEHHYSYHTETGCQQIMVVYGDVAPVGQVQIGAFTVQCKCVKYVGPEPLTEVIP